MSVTMTTDLAKAREMFIEKCGGVDKAKKVMEQAWLDEHSLHHCPLCGYMWRPDCPACGYNWRDYNEKV